MKQLIIGQNKAYASGVTFDDITAVGEGQIAVFDLATNKLVDTLLCRENGFSSVAIVLGRKTGTLPFLFPEVNVHSLTVSKGKYTEGSKFTATITVPTPEKGEHYTVIVAKHGVVFNERNRWTFTSMAKDTMASNVAKDLVNQINANKHTSGVEATYSGGAITVKALKEGEDYSLVGADSLTGVLPTAVTEGKKAMLDKAYVQDLASRCAAGKGFNYLAEDGKEIYPGYPEEVTADKYNMYSLRFAVPRVAAKQRDEVVYQIVHIAVPQGSDCESTLDTIFGIEEESGD